MASGQQLLTAEEFVFSTNRRKLLGIQNDTNDNSDFEPSSIVYGSGQHLHYQLLQIENEITAILINNDLDNIPKADTNKIQLLLNEATDIISKYELNKNKSDEVNTMAFRHKLRQLFLSPYIATKQKTKNDDEKTDNHDIFDILINKIGINFNYSKPMDVMVDNNNENDAKIQSVLEPIDLKKKFNELFIKCKDMATSLTINPQQAAAQHMNNIQQFPGQIQMQYGMVNPLSIQQQQQLAAQQFPGQMQMQYGMVNPLSIQQQQQLAAQQLAAQQLAAQQ
eukprot:541901_1